MSKSSMGRRDEINAGFDVLWSQRLSGLKAFHDVHGRVPTAEEDRVLFRWMRVQRYRQSEGTLRANRDQQLSALSFWRRAQPLDGLWLRSYAMLRAYQEDYGNVPVPPGWPENPSLSIWFRNQRTKYRSNLLQPNRRKMLDALNFNWGVSRDRGSWVKYYARLVKFHRREGHAAPTAEDGDKKLANWVSNNRSQRRLKRLSRKRVALLNKLGFVWTLSPSTVWADSLAVAQKFHARHGHLNVRPRCYSQLSRWLSTQRDDRNKKIASVERIAQLDALGMRWDLQEDSWQAQLANLKAYGAEQGHVSPRRAINGGASLLSLCCWAYDQRVFRAKKTLDASRIQQLDEIGFIWDSAKAKEDAKWMGRYNEMTERYAKQGPSLPSRVDVPRTLRRWMDAQSRASVAGLLSPKRAALLARLGIVWDLPLTKRQT